MTKPVILQTIPHSGTHTMLNLLAVLGGLKVYWHHWEPNSEAMLRELPEYDLSNFVFVHTYRPFFSLLDSHAGRSQEFDDTYLRQCHAIYEANRYNFPEPIVLPIEAPNAVKTYRVMKIFEACGTFPTDKAYAYMRNWDKTNQQGAERWRGFKSDEEFKAVRKVVTRAHLRDKELEPWLTK